MISCATSLALDLIKPHDRLDHHSPEGNVFSSSVDKIKDESHLNVHMLSRKPKLKSSNEEAPIVSSSDKQPNKEQFVTICSKEYSNTTSTRNTGDKNCQADKSDMQPVKPKLDMWSNRPAVPIQQRVPQEDDKNCQVDMKLVSDGKKSQSIKYIKSG